jgi:hypothetical protein
MSSAIRERNKMFLEQKVVGENRSFIELLAVSGFF